MSGANQAIGPFASGPPPATTLERAELHELHYSLLHEALSLLLTMARANGDEVGFEEMARGFGHGVRDSFGIDAETAQRVWDAAVDDVLAGRPPSPPIKARPWGD